jgi:hypothetical protein
MPAHHRRAWWGLAVVAAFAAAACSDTTGPQAHLSDPATLSSDLQTVSGVLLSPAFQSFGALSDTATGSPVAAPSRVGMLLRAAPFNPPRTSAALQANAAARMQALRRGAAAFSGGINPSVVPPALLGTTWVWNTTNHKYEQDGTFTPAAPIDRVRIILYAVDPITGAIVETPLTATGFVDLVDESTTAPAVDRLHVIVSGGTPASPGTVYANYTVSGQVTGNPATAFTATAAGFVSDGTHTLTFSATFAASQLNTDNPDVQIDITWDLDNPAIHVALHETLVRSDATHLTLTITEFSITHGAETVSMHGTITITFLSPTTETVTMDLTIDVNDVPWIRIRGTDNGITVRHNDGSQLTQAEGLAFLDLFGLPGAIEFAILSLFNPCQTLMGA